MTTTRESRPAAQRSPGPLELIDDDACRVFQDATELAGRKWNSGIMLAIQRGASRFSEIRAHVDGISDRMLAARLRELEDTGLVVRTVIPSTPVQVAYSLSPAGAELLDVLSPLIGWSHRWRASTSRK